VRGDAGLGLYQAEATSHSILAKDGKPDLRIVVNINEQPLGCAKATGHAQAPRRLDLVVGEWRPEIDQSWANGGCKWSTR
jgi:hypothetical protein